eukprot:1149897-Pelagomonas_calceolata.AAC.1
MMPAEGVSWGMLILKVVHQATGCAHLVAPEFSGGEGGPGAQVQGDVNAPSHSQVASQAVAGVDCTQSKNLAS